MGKSTKKPWGGRFSGSASEIAEKISSSVHFDSRLYRQDIRGSIAHAKMLESIGLLTGDELKKIINGLQEIEKEIDNGSFDFKESLEDVHMNIEASLVERIGDAGRKLHTGRSRNDQIALDVKLYIRDEAGVIEELIKNLISALSDISERYIDVILPGYTHMQVAQPVRFSHHMLAYAWKFMRDMKRLGAAVDACSELPLGSGAVAGVNYQTDSEFLKEELGFNDISNNSMDTVSSRDFVLDFLYFSSMLGMHLSRLCEELVLWSSVEFGFIKLSDAVTTGSSIMPQKRNPDIAELLRGKTGRLYGNLISMLTIMKGLPMTYNRDMQEDKEPLFDSVDTVIASLSGMIEMISTMEVNADRMRGSVRRNFSTATDIADYLAKKGIPFRKSHEIVGNIVRHCEEKGIDYFSLTYNDLKAFSDAFDKDAAELLEPENSTERKESPGSTSIDEIKKQLKKIRNML